MKLPKNNNELTKIFKEAKVPEISEFKGEYAVDMLTRLPSLKKFSHRKIFYTKDNKTLGHNILFAKTIWGRFFLENGMCEQLESLKVLIINYNVDENSFISRRIIDQVRCLEKNNLYLGRLNYRLGGKLYFLGYFSLQKIK